MACNDHIIESVSNDSCAHETARGKLFPQFLLILLFSVKQNTLTLNSKKAHFSTSSCSMFMHKIIIPNYKTQLHTCMYKKLKLVFVHATIL